MTCKLTYTLRKQIILLTIVISSILVLTEYMIISLLNKVNKYIQEWTLHRNIDDIKAHRKYNVHKMIAFCLFHAPRNENFIQNKRIIHKYAYRRQRPKLQQEITLQPPSNLSYKHKQKNSPDLVSAFPDFKPYYTRIKSKKNSSQ